METTPGWVSVTSCESGSEPGSLRDSQAECSWRRLRPTRSVSSVKAPGPGQVVIAQVSGTSTGNKPPRLTLTNPGALRGTVIASSIWKAKAGGAAYDGVIVLIRKAGQASSARTPAGARRPAIFNSPVILTVGLIVNLHVTLKLLEPTVERIREAARRTQCKNNLKSLALEVHNSYYGSPRPPTPPRTAVRYVCGGLDDQTVAGAPRFWNFFGQPSCAIHVRPVWNCRRRGSDLRPLQPCGGRVRSLPPASVHGNGMPSVRRGRPAPYNPMEESSSTSRVPGRHSRNVRRTFG